MTPSLGKGLAWMLLTIVVWAPMFPTAKRALPVVDAFTLSSIRYVLGGAIFLLLVVAIEGGRALRFGDRIVPAIVLGLIGITGFNTFVWVGLTYARPEHAAIIMAIQTPLTALLVWLLRGQRPARFTLGCIALAIAGVLIVVTRGDPLAALASLGKGDELFGDILVFCGALCWVAYTMGSGTFPGWTALRFTALTIVPGALGLLAVNAVALAAGLSVPPDAAAVASIAPQIAYFAVGTVVLGVLGFNASVTHLGPLNVMLMLNVIPVSVFAIEAALGRDFAPVELAGAAMVIGALVANNLYLRRRR
ncbi:MAG: DMT family transporter [Burkholderiales bacterium]|nr:DMT family transporter [Burkholderiales bacterium]